MFSEPEEKNSKTLPTQNNSKIIQNSDNLIEVTKSEKSECWMVKFGITCHICHNVWHNKVEFDSHFRRDHDGTVTYTCTPCGKQMEKYHNYKSHCYRHVTKFKCPHCEKSYPQLSRLVTHLNADHADKPEENEDTIAVRTKGNRKKQFQCPHCPKKLVSVSGLQFHIKTNHQSELPLAVSQDFTCKECGKILKSLSGLQLHIAVHQSAKQYVCDICEKIFLQLESLQKHTQNEHTGHKPFTCSLCPLLFDTESALKKHSPFHNEERAFLCTVCNKCFKTKRCLKVHSRLHIKVTSDILCSICGKQFINSTKLRQHMNIHNGERPYPCKYCTFTFTNFSNWMKHTIRMHKVDHRTGEPLTHKRKQDTNNDNNNFKQKDMNMSKQNEKEIFDTTNLFDDENQETLVEDKSGSLTEFSAKKHDFGMIFDKNGNYKVENEIKTTNNSLSENSSSINFANFHKRVKLDQIVLDRTISNNDNTEIYLRTVSAEEICYGFAPRGLESESESSEIGTMHRSVELENPVFSKNLLSCNPVNSEKQSDSVKLYPMQKDTPLSVVSKVTDTVDGSIDNDMNTFQSSAYSPILIMAVPTTTNTNLQLNTINKNYTTFVQNAIEPETIQPVNLVDDKPQVQKYLNKHVEPVKICNNNEMCDKQKQHHLTDNITHGTQILIIYNDPQEKDCINNNDVSTQISLDNCLSTQQFIDKEVSQEQILTENHVHMQQKIISQEFVNGNELEERTLTGNMREDVERLCNNSQRKHLLTYNILQSQLNPAENIVQRRTFINKNQMKVVQGCELTTSNECMANNVISGAVTLIDNNKIHPDKSFTDNILYEKNMVQKSEFVKEITDCSISEVMEFLKQDICDVLKTNSLEQELITEKTRQDKDIVKEKTMQDELKLFKNNVFNRFPSNIPENLQMNEAPERTDFVNDNFERKNSDLTYASVNLSSALGLDEGSHLAHIDPNLTYKLTHFSEKNVNSSNPQLPLGNNYFSDNTSDSIPESLLASGTDTLFMNHSNLRMMTQYNTQELYDVDPLVMFNPDEVDLFNIDVQDVLDTFKNLETVDGFLNLEPTNGSISNKLLDASGASKGAQPYISGEFLVVPPPIDM